MNDLCKADHACIRRQDTRLRRYFSSLFAALFGLLFLPNLRVARADIPIGSDYHRNLTITVQPTSVRVKYRIELNAFTLALDVTKKDSGFKLPNAGKPGYDDFVRAFLDRMEVVLPDRFQGICNQTPLVFRCLSRRESRPTPDSVQFLFELQATLPAKAGTNELMLFDTNFPDKKGKVQIAFDLVESVDFESFSNPIERLITTPDVARSDTPELKATFVLTPEQAAVKPVINDQPAGTPPATTSPPAQSLITRLFKEGLQVLLSSNVGLPLLLCLAFFFGAAHALTPGHGKTLVAAYLIGEKGTIGHAIFLGVVTTITHTGMVILVALGLWIWFPNTAQEDVKRVLGLVGGLMIVMLGIWILINRLAGRADHIHLSGHSHSHSHGDDHDHGHSHGIDATTTWKQLIILGITGGLVPCWDAVLLLGISISTNQLPYAVPLLLSFSAGLAATLVAIGIAVLRANRYGNLRWSEKSWMKALPVISAVLVIIIGLALCLGSV